LFGFLREVDHRLKPHGGIECDPGLAGLRDRLHQRSQPGAHFEQSHQVVFANIQKGQLIGAGAKAAGNDTGASETDG
jgi:hypothetical protein